MEIEIKQPFHLLKESNRNGPKKKTHLLVMEISHLLTGVMVI